MLLLHKAHTACSASERTIPSLTVPRTLTRSQRSPLTDFGAINSEAITLAFCTMKTGLFSHRCLDCDAMAGLPCLEEGLDRFRYVVLLAFVIDKEHWNEELLL